MPLTTTLARIRAFASRRSGGSGSVVEHLLAKEKVTGSNPVFRSNDIYAKFLVLHHVFGIVTVIKVFYSTVD